MEISNQGDVEGYLNRKRSWLLGFGLQQLPDRAMVEDVIQELAAWALVQVARGRVFNDSYLFLRFRSLLRDARRDWMRSSPEIDQDETTSPNPGDSCPDPGRCPCPQDDDA